MSNSNNSSVSSSSSSFRNSVFGSSDSDSENEIDKNTENINFSDDSEDDKSINTENNEDMSDDVSIKTIDFNDLQNLNSKKNKKKISNKIYKNPKNAIFKFFNLKEEYEKKIRDNKKKIINLFKKENKRGNIKKGKCISCNREVGTIFTIKKNQYSAKCGDKINPCKLDILITREIVSYYKEMIDLFFEDIEKEQAAIIQNKQNVLFGYITEQEGIKRNEKLLNDYNNSKMVYTDYNENYQNIIMSEERNTEIHKLQNEIEEHIREIQYYYSRTTVKPNPETIIQIYLQEILPKIKKMRNLKYPLIEVIYNDETKISVLYKYNILPENEILSIDDIVVKWVI